MLEMENADPDSMEGEESSNEEYADENDMTDNWNEYGSPTVKDEPIDLSCPESLASSQARENTELQENSSDHGLLPENDHDLSSENSASMDNFEYSIASRSDIADVQDHAVPVNMAPTRARSRKPKMPLRSSGYHKCKFCSYTTTNHSNLVRHEQRHLGTRPFACDNCDYAATTNSELKKHVAKHSDDKPFKCTKCSYSARQASDLVVHDKIHAGIKAFKCTQCDYAGVTSNKLKRHMRVHSESRPYACSLCDYSCKDSSRLKEHLRIHNGIKPYKCPFCEHTAVSHANLRRHRATHTGIKPNKCPICDYTCIRPSDLRLHMRKHTGEKPYSCHLCDFSASSHSNLRRHQYVHTGQKPHKCEICDYSCTNRSRLTEHMRIHTGQKPYTCSICGYKCSQSSILNSHRKRKHQHELNMMNPEQNSEKSPERDTSEKSSELLVAKSSAKDVFKVAIQAVSARNMDEELSEDNSETDTSGYSDGGLVTPNENLTIAENLKYIACSGAVEKERLMAKTDYIVVNNYLNKEPVISGNDSDENTDEELLVNKMVVTPKNKNYEWSNSLAPVEAVVDTKDSIAEDLTVKINSEVQHESDSEQSGKEEPAPVIKTEPAFVAEPENAYYPW